MLTPLAVKIELGNDTTLCSGGSIMLQSGNSLATNYLWSSGSTDSFLLVDSTDNYLLTVNNGLGCAGIDSIQVTIKGHSPVVAFSVDTVCLGDSIYFMNTTSVSPPDDINVWEWNFGDGNLSFVANPNHEYDSSGTYWVSLFAESDSGCVNNLSRQVLVLDKSIPDFFVMPSGLACTNTEITFESNSITASGDSIVQFFWDFGDGSTATGLDTFHTYLLADTFIVQLDIETHNNCLFDTAKTIFLFDSLSPPLPFSGITPQNNCVLSDTSFVFFVEFNRKWSGIWITNIQ